MPLARLSKAIVSQVGSFTQTLGEACPKPSRKFIHRMTLGLVMSGSVLLSEAARKLQPLRAISFHASHKGLCRGLKSRRWAALPVQEAYLRFVAPFLPRKRIIACDMGDITKPSGRKMPGLRTVRDGSTGRLKKGWWLVEIEAFFGKGMHLPLWLELFSVNRRCYKSQRSMVEDAITMLVRCLGTGGLWVFDRGFDNWKTFAFLAGLKLQFLIRVNAKRVVVDGRDGKERSLGKISAAAVPSGSFLWGRKRAARGYLIEVAFASFLIPQNGQELSLVVAHGFGRHPLLLATNVPVLTGKQAVKMVRDYLKRWSVEEAGRLVKQAFDLENIRVLTWPGLVKLVWMAMWSYGLMCLMRVRARRLCAKIIAAYPSFGPTPRFPYYRIAGGLAWILTVASLVDPPLLFDLEESG